MTFWTYSQSSELVEQIFNWSHKIYLLLGHSCAAAPNSNFKIIYCLSEAVDVEIQYKLHYEHLQSSLASICLVAAVHTMDKNV